MLYGVTFQEMVLFIVTNVKISVPEVLNNQYIFLYQELVPPETHSEFANSRDQIRIILNGISRLKQIADVLALRSHG